jgi:hypothetical protein
MCTAVRFKGSSLINPVCPKKNARRRDFWDNKDFIFVRQVHLTSFNSGAGGSKDEGAQEPRQAGRGKGNEEGHTNLLKKRPWASV